MPSSKAGDMAMRSEGLRVGAAAAVDLDMGIAPEVDTPSKAAGDIAEPQTETEGLPEGAV
jgi:hypothetical protein